MTTTPNCPYYFLKEQLNHCNRYNLHNQITFKPDTKFIPTAIKFYSNYDAKESLINIKPEKLSHYTNIVEKKLNGKPRMQYKAPMTESQEIGWISEPIFTYDGIDKKLFYHPLTNDFTHIENENIVKNYPLLRKFNTK